MELRHLRYFVAVSEALHFGRAAESLKMSQPPLSKQIQDLEAEVGVRLLYRTKRHVELTRAGREFLEHAKQILAMADQASSRARSVGEGEIGQLVIGFTGGTIYDLQPIVREFNTVHPQVDVVLRRLVTSDQVHALHNRTIAIGHLMPPVRSDALHFLPVRAECMVAALPETHPLATAEQPIDISALSTESFIMAPRTAGLSYYDAIIGCCKRGGFIPNVSMEVDHLESIIGFVSIGMGISLVPESLTQFEVRGVAYKAIKNAGRTIETALAWRKDDDSPILQTFVEFATKTRHTEYR